MKTLISLLSLALFLPMFAAAQMQPVQITNTCYGAIYPTYVQCVQWTVWNYAAKTLNPGGAPDGGYVYFNPDVPLSSGAVVAINGPFEDFKGTVYGAKLILSNSFTYFPADGKVNFIGCTVVQSTPDWDAHNPHMVGCQWTDLSYNPPLPQTGYTVKTWNANFSGGQDGLVQHSGRNWGMGSATLVVPATSPEEGCTSGDDRSAAE